MNQDNRPPKRSDDKSTPLDDNLEDWDFDRVTSSYSENFPLKIGLWMTVLAWICVLLVLSFLFNSWLKPSQPEIIVDNNQIQMVLKRNHQSQYILEGEINGQSAIFLIDTGATDIVIPGPMAEELGLAQGRAGKAMTAGGPITVYATKLNQIKMGPFLIKNIRAIINPTMTEPVVLLGMSALKHVHFYQRGDTLLMYVDKPGSSKRSTNWFSSQHHR